MILDHINDIASICAGHGITDAIISPGSRSAPLTLAFVRHPEIQTRVIPDERSAAFVAMGIAQQQKRPVVLVCTSGSAAYNYAPAVAEAYFQEIPLLVLTADRPPEWINQYDGQTIQQSGIYGDHVKASFDFPVDASHPDAKWHSNRIVNEAILSTQAFPKGPAHINVPFREPFYPSEGESTEFGEVRVIRESKVGLTLNEQVLNELQSEWNKFERIAIVAGQNEFSVSLSESLNEFSKKANVPIIADLISNQHGIEESIRHQDAFLRPSEYGHLAPDLLVTFGKSLISKNLKTFLRQNPPRAHWHINLGDRLNDSLQHMTKLIKTNPAYFFEAFKPKSIDPGFKNSWVEVDRSAKTIIQNQLDSADFGEFKAVQTCLKHLPANSQLHLANSMAVRYANLIGLKDGQEITVFANRGTSGIDGSNSTAVGASLAQGEMVTLITGDMAFFYDRNAFWHNYDLKNLRIIMLNNHAGGIFRLIDGPSRQPELEEYFETEQKLDAKHTATDFGFAYELVHDEDELSSALTDFYAPSANARILEIKSSSETNAKVFNSFKKAFQRSF